MSSAAALMGRGLSEEEETGCVVPVVAADGGSGNGSSAASAVDTVDPSAAVGV